MSLSHQTLKMIQQFAGCKLVFFDAGTYYITDTLYIPAGSQIAGEAWSVILGGGANFEDQSNPRVMVQAGEPWSNGVLEISDIIFSTVGPGKSLKTIRMVCTDCTKHLVPSSSSGTYMNLGTSKVVRVCGTHISGMFEYLIFEIN